MPNGRQNPAGPERGDVTDGQRPGAAPEDPAAPGAAAAEETATAGGKEGAAAAGRQPERPYPKTGEWATLQPQGPVKQIYSTCEKTASWPSHTTEPAELHMHQSKFIRFKEGPQGQHTSC